MRTFTTAFMVLLFSAVNLWGQSARVQIIHNSPAPEVDVYVNGQPLLDNFKFRTATPFVDVPAGLLLDIAIAPASSTSAADAIANFPVTFDNGKTYVVTASGVVGNPTTPFTLVANAAGQETSTNPNKVQFAVLHGSPDAPAVDVAVRTGGNLVGNLAYGSFTSYLSVDPGVYYLDVKPAGSNAIVQTFKADLSGLAGAAAYVFASGFLAGTPGFGLFAALPNGDVVEFPATPVARVQVIHNSPSPTVDVWANEDLLLDNFAFRTATPFVYLPAGVDINLGVALDTSTSAASSIANFNVNFTNGKTYVVTASGIVGNPDTPFELLVNDQGREKSTTAGKVEVAVLHGAPEVPGIDIGVGFAAPIITDFTYRETTSYLSLDPGKYNLVVRIAGGTSYSDSYFGAFVADLSGLAGKSAYVFASGLLSDLPPVGLFAALADGSVVELPSAPQALVQVIHNSPSPSVDVYVGNMKLVDNFTFRTATPRVLLPADLPFDLSIAPSNSASSNDAIAAFPVTLAPDGNYRVIANGIVGNLTTPFTLAIDGNAQFAVAAGNVSLGVFHGAPDAPAVDIAVVGSGNIVTDLAFGEFSNYTVVPPAAYQIQVKPAGSATVLATYAADIAPLNAQGIQVFASGFLNGTPAFGLFAVTPNGGVIELSLVPKPAFARLQVIHNSPSPTVDVYVNGDKLLDDFTFRTATPFIDVPANVALNIGVAPANSQSVNDVIANFPATFEEGKTYVAVASGVLGNTTTPFTLIVNNAGQELASVAGKVDIAVLHGSPNAPAVDVDEFFAGNILSGLSYGQFTPYLSLDPGIYDLSVRTAGNPAVVATFRADLSSLTGAAAYVFASGLVGGNPGFGLFAALPNGTVIPLPLTPTARIQVVHNSPEPTVDVYLGQRQLLDDFEFRTATPFVNLPAGRNFNIGVAPANSSSAADAIANFPVNLTIGKSYTVFAGGIVGNGATPFTLFVDDNALESAPAGNVAVGIFHGSPGAPSVDIVERLDGALAADVAYGEFTPYLQLPPDFYVIDVKVAGTSPIVATYAVDLSDLDGVAMRVFASGLLGGTPAFGLFAVLADGTVVELTALPLARVQIVHNSPTPTVDVYAGSDLLIDDFEFRTATPFFYVPAGFPINIGVAPGNSQSASEVIANFPLTFENGKTYTAFANGIVGSPTAPFTLTVNADARERAVSVDKLELSILHGAPDAPAVNVVPFGSDVPLLTNLAFGQFTPYVSLDPAVYYLDVVPSASPNQVVGTWGADFTDANGVTGVVFASGLLGGNPDFDLFLVLPNGLVLPLPAWARAQVIHNSPNPTVDVYYSDDDVDARILNDFQFRQATPVLLLPARLPFTLSVAPGTSTTVNDAIYDVDVELETGKTYIVMAAGVVGGAKPFELYVNPNGRFRAQTAGNVDLSLFHGSPDAPEVDVTLPTGTPIFDNVQFGEFADYISVPASTYVVNVTPANDNNTIVQSYLANVSTLGGQAATVFASGFLASGTPGFEVWVALTDGATFPLPVYVSTNELDNNLQSLQLSPNPAVSELQLRFRLSESETLRFRVRDVAGRLLQEGDFGVLGAGEFTDKIQVDNLPAGMYQLELVSDNGLRTAKFAVQR